MAGADDVHGEGLRIPPLHLVRAGEIEPEALGLVRANMRCPDEREGDLLAQWATNRIGAARLVALAEEHGADEVRRRAQELMDWTERLTRALVRSLPARRVAFADALEDGCARVPIRLALARRGTELVCDFRASGAAPRSSLNATRAVTRSAVFYCLRALLPPGTPANDGIVRPVRLLTTPGTVVDAAYPSGVAAGNVETSQRLVDVLFGALARLLPGRLPAASAGTMSNLAFAGPGFTYYETLPGGAGASARGAGASAIQTHMTNTRNTPIEAFERLYPVRIERLALRRGSGGAGRHRGGDGVRKRLRFLVETQVSFFGDRQRTRPWGLAGGSDARSGRVRLRRPGKRAWVPLPARWSGTVPAGSVLEIETPGGGGYGRAPRRGAER
jgi:N-methylhydantoinase B